jgi:formate hydrogenlyase subunit 6/NADH:ubiquinone oxidoreductase subunit I
MLQEASAMEKTVPQLDEQLCNLCGLCVDVCPCGSVELDEQSLLFSCPDVCERQTEKCNCGCLCEEACPTGAISVAFEIVLDEGDKARSIRGKADGKDL